MATLQSSKLVYIRAGWPLRLGKLQHLRCYISWIGFRITNAVTVYFRLTQRQLYAINAFTNSCLDKEVYVGLSDGYSESGYCLRLLRALYGLRISPWLWQKDPSEAFGSLGFQPLPQEPCLLVSNHLLVYYYVDYIVFQYHIDHKDFAERSSKAYPSDFGWKTKVSYNGS
jgi:hypothetical protein